MGLSLALWASRPMRVARQSKACRLCLGRVAGVAVAQRHFRRLLGPADSRGNRRFGKLHILGNTHEGTKRRHFAKISQTLKSGSRMPDVPAQFLSTGLYSGPVERT